MGEDEQLRRKRTAYHEAAHAVIARDLSIAVRSIDLKEDEFALGHAKTYSRGKWLLELDNAFDRMPCSTRCRLEHEIMVFWAGTLAEQIFLKIDVATTEVGFGIHPDGEERWVSRGSDVSQIGTLVEKVFIDNAERIAFVEWLRIRTFNKLKSPVNAIMIPAVAEELLLRGHLTGKQIVQTSNAALMAAIP